MSNDTSITLQKHIAELVFEEVYSNHVTPALNDALNDNIKPSDIGHEFFEGVLSQVTQFNGGRIDIDAWNFSAHEFYNHLNTLCDERFQRECNKAWLHRFG